MLLELRETRWVKQKQNQTNYAVSPFFYISCGELSRLPRFIPASAVSRSWSTEAALSGGRAGFEHVVLSSSFEHVVLSTSFEQVLSTWF